MIRFLNAGESHGPELTVVVEGVPAGLAVDFDGISLQLARRQKGFGAGGRMRIERDQANITAGVVEGRTTGAPIAMRVENRDFANWKDREIDPMVVPRPGHADLVGALKYGYPDLRYSLERASARETTTRVAVGALCRQLLAACGIDLGGYVVRMGAVGLEDELPPTADVDALRGRIDRALEDDLCCPLPERHQAFRDAIQGAMKAKDTLGGTFEVVALGLPPGLGSYVHWDRRLDGQLAQAMLSIQAMKGVEIGSAFANAHLRGTEVHDEIFLEEQDLVRRSNRAGGLEGGVTSGAPLVVRVAMKPISTTLNPRQSVDLHKGEAATTSYERSDFSALARAVPIGESMLAFVLANALLEKVGGDSLDEMLPRVEQLRRGTLDDLALRGTAWKFGYP